MLMVLMCCSKLRLESKTTPRFVLHTYWDLVNMFEVFPSLYDLGPMIKSWRKFSDVHVVISKIQFNSVLISPGRVEYHQHSYET